MSLVGNAHRRLVYGRRIDRLARAIAEALEGDASVLDVGCGDGLLSSRILQLRPGLTVTGIDVLVREGAHIPVSAFDGESIPYPDDSFDAVLFSDVLHHTTDPSALLREASRVSRRAVVVKDHLRHGLLAGLTLRVMDIVGNRHHGVALPFNYWPQARWSAAFENLGLEVASWKGKLGLYPFPFSLAFDRSLHFIARLEHSGS